MSKLHVIGDPVLHSKSPAIQNAMLAALGLEPCYSARVVKRGELPAFLAAAKAEGVTGFNATMPHKVDLIPLLDGVDEDGALYGAVNTVCIREGKLYGHNTDGAGFVAALADLGVTPSGKTILLLGAGGAAKAVALKLSASGAGCIHLCNRTAEKAALLCEKDPFGTMIPAGFTPGILTELAPQCDVVVNCTSLGMAGVEGQFESFDFLDALPAHAAVCDLIYNPMETQLLAQAKQRGLKHMNGLGMLIHQAIYALEWFLDRELDHGAMADVVRKALN